MTTRLLLALTTVLALLLPTAALAAPSTPTLAAASSATEDEHADDEHAEEGADDEHAEEGADDGHAEEGDDGHGDDHEPTNMDNGDPADAGAQALAGSSGASFVTVMLWVMGALVLALMVGGLTLGRGRNA